jgi:alginate O-acetyltransferase complex protein AlgI
MSLIFYSWWNYLFILLIIGSIVSNYIIGECIIYCNKKANNKSNRFLVIGIFLNLIVLAYFKYFNFFIDNVNYLFSTDITAAKIILPIGISFYTFTQIAYLVDIYKEKVSKNYHFSTYFLFVVYFPHLIAGPILNHKEMMPQIENQNIISFNSKNFILGFSVFAIALFKKVVIADYFSSIVVPVFSASSGGNVLTFFDSWISAISYTIQIYFDFSGYSEMAIGMSLMLNIFIPANFFSPYKSNSIEEFWHRWHISLSRFLRDYLYIPLGGNRKGAFRQKINLMLTMLIGGFWHGASWTFLIWGSIHGLFLMVNHSFKGKQFFKSYFAKWALTFFVVVNLWVVFRAESLMSAFSIYKSMYNIFDIGLPVRLSNIYPINSVPYFNFNGIFRYISLDYKMFVLFITLALFIAFLMPNLYQLFSPHKIALITYRDNVSALNKQSIIRWKSSLYWALFIGFIFALSFLSVGSATEFLYFQF